MNVPKLRFKEFNDEWVKFYTGDLCDIQTGKSNTQDKIENGLYPFYVRSAIVEHSNKYIFDTEAVLTVGDGVGTGKVFHYVNGKFDCHQRVYVMNNFKNVTAKFFYYLFSKDFIKRVNSMTAKTSVDSVRYEMIDKMIMYLPTLYEQQKIGTFLSLLDKKIELQSKKIEALKLYKMCISHMLFSYANRKICLKDLVECKSSNISLSDIEFNNGKYPIYGANGIIKYISSFDFENNYIGIIKDGSGVGKTIICEKFSSILTTMNALIPIKQENLFYINELINQINFNKYVVGSGIPHIYFRDYCNEQLYIHEDESRLKIGKYIENIDKKIRLEEKKCHQIDLLKKGLMQNMFI